eukprot:6211485-Ditylum_brightwellii.AAC.1
MFWQVCFVKDAKRSTKKSGLSDKEVEDLNVFVNNKIDKTTKHRNCDMHVMSNFKDLFISSSNESIQSIMNDTSVGSLYNGNCKPASKK